MKKYLLERYPAIWNIQIVWLFPLILLAHLFFFGLGFVMLSDEAMSNYYYYLGDNFKGLPMLLNFIIIVLLLVGWLIYLFRNNAFKRFYPVSCWQLFGRFVVYFAVIGGIISSSFSFMAGEKAKVYWRYTDSYIHSVLRQYPEYISDSEMKQFSEAQREEYYIAHNASLIKERVFIEKFDAQINFIIIIAFLLTLLLFAVRITSLRTVLLSIVFSGLLCLLLALVVTLIVYVDTSIKFKILAALSLLWISYLSVVFLSITSKKKLYRGIAMNASLFGFFPAIVITFVIIEDRYNLWKFIEYYLDPIKNDIKILILWGIGILLSLVFIGLYTSVIKRWKAMPE